MVTLTLDWTREGLGAEGPTKDKAVAQAGDKAGKEVTGPIRDRHRDPRNQYQEELRVTSQGQHGSWSMTRKDARKLEGILVGEIFLILARHSPPLGFDTITASS